MIKRQFTLYLDNKPGMLAKVTGLLSKRKINIEGVSVAETPDASLIQLVVDKAKDAAAILKKGGFSFDMQDVVVLRRPDRPGALHAIANQLAKQGININYLYATTSGTGGSESTIVISGDDLKRIDALSAA